MVFVISSNSLIFLLTAALSIIASCKQNDTSGSYENFTNNIIKTDMDSIPERNGFILSDLRIPLDEVLSGGPPRDGIPAINEPIFLKASEADFLTDDDEVLAITKNGIVKAYPIRIMNYHEVVNDFFGKDPVVITFCPLCGSGIAFSGNVNGKYRTFGVSGLLFNSDVLLYDRETESLWSQLMGYAVSGPSVDQKFELVSMEQTSWSEWKERNPGTLVLSTETGFSRDYTRLPYDGYESSSQLYFPVKNKNDALPNKERVIGISVNNVHKAYAFSKLRKVDKLPISDTVEGMEIQIHFNKESNSAKITDKEGNLLNGTTLFWFAWFAFHPDTEVY